MNVGRERLTPKLLDHCLHLAQGMLQLLRCFFPPHLLIQEDPDHHQNLITCSFSTPDPP